jgi:hypothetical protein
MIIWLTRLPVMHLPTKFGHGCQLHQQLSLGQFFGEWDCFKFVMFLIPVNLLLIGLLLICIVEQLSTVFMLYIQFSSTRTIENNVYMQTRISLAVVE